MKPLEVVESLKEDYSHTDEVTGDISPAPSGIIYDSVAERRLVRKLDLHVLPPLFVLLLVAFLDRINIGNARILGLEEDLGMVGNDYAIALQVFFVLYIVLEIPSNLALQKIAPSTWLSGIMCIWGEHFSSGPCPMQKPLLTSLQPKGIITICQGLTQSFAGLVVCRVLLGAFEAGFMPGKNSTVLI
jgi:MFS family permease